MRSNVLRCCLVTLTAVLAGACGGGAATSPSVSSSAPPPSAPVSTVTTASPSAGTPRAAVSPATAVVTAVATATTMIELAARDSLFDPREVRVPAGQEVTLTLRNEGDLLHDWHVLGVTNRDGTPITTALIEHGQAVTVRFTIAQPGEFAFFCEVHPVEMRGKLTVE